ncbi:MAG: hypothetical protein KGZ40_05345 [Clostridiales bacterium]|nr:hypothetical protein [Clostridiales bacterium]
MSDSEGALEHEVIRFVEDHVGSLLAWDIIVFFHRHPDEAFDPEVLASQLGRGPAELIREVEALSAEGILQTAGGLVRFSSDSALAPMVTAFVEACRNRTHRLSLIARVLQRIGASSEE